MILRLESSLLLLVLLLVPSFFQIRALAKQMSYRVDMRDATREKQGKHSDSGSQEHSLMRIMMSQFLLPRLGFIGRARVKMVDP